MATKAIPREQIEWIVRRFHVGTETETIARDIRRRLRKNPWIATPAGQRFEDRCVAYALKCHAHNGQLYRDVTGGYLH
jgi:hypothetical protein